MNSLMCLATALACLCACKGSDPVPTPQDTRSLSITPTQVELGCEQSPFELRVTANFDYKVTEDADWIQEDPSKQSTSTLLCFIATQNTVNAPREAKIRITDKNDRYYYKEVSVTQAANPVSTTVLNIVDKDATPETKALLANLWDIADKGWMFGHHDDLWYGRYWYNEAGNSDTKAVCGDYPAVFSVDLAEIMHSGSTSSGENAIRRRVILEARERGEVILACAHLNNPKTGNSSWLQYESDKEAAKMAVKEILTEGSATRSRYFSWLDNLASFANNIKDARGNLVPMILRIFHEHTQSWSWWGTSCASDQEFVQLWRMTVEYLRDTKGVHNFLYAVSPQMDAVYANAQERIKFRWPGDDYVDFIGMDCYHGTNDNAFSSNLEALSAVSRDKKKPCGVTEDGQESFTDSKFWSRHVLAPLQGKRVSMVTMWRNKYVGNNESDKHYYSVYPGHPSEDDFREMYNDERSLFSRDLPDMYTLPAGYEIK